MVMSEDVKNHENVGIGKVSKGALRSDEFFQDNDENGEILHDEKSNRFEISTYCTDNLSGSLNEVKPTGVLDLFQTVAGMHAAALGVSMTDLMNNGRCWVLESVVYESIFPISAHSRVSVKTWFHKPGRLFCCRDYSICDESGAELVKGTSRWLVIDVKTRKPVLNAIDYGCDGSDERNFVEHNKIRLSFENAETLGRFTVGKSSSDIVGHMNNTRYADVIFEFFPCALKKLQIDYVKECKVGETLEVKKLDDGDKIFVEGNVSGERRFVAELVLAKI